MMSLPTLKDYRGETIDMACRRCDRYGVYERKALVKKFGASIQFAQLRRIMTIGCERGGTDQCEASFPCLLTANLSIGGADE